MEQYEVIIIGAGTAGISAAKEVKKYTDNYLLVGAEPLGTLCARAGCMPSKTIIELANLLNSQAKLNKIGILKKNHMEIDDRKLMEYVRKLRDHFVGGVKQSMEALNFIEGRVKFLSKDTIIVGKKELKANKFIIATGVKPKIPDIFQKYRDDILTYENIFDLKKLPKNIAIIGSGAIAIELGQALARLGVEVSILSHSNNLAHIDNKEVKNEALRILKKDMDLYLSSEIVFVKREGKFYQIQLKDKLLKVESILSAIGSAPEYSSLNLKSCGLKIDNEGEVLKYDPISLNIEGTNIYLAGDVNNNKKLQHVAAFEGKKAARNALNIKNKLSEQTHVAIIFSHPSIASVGLTESQINSKFISGEVNFKNQGRALIMQENAGLMKINVGLDGIIKGAEMIAPQAEHLTHFLLLAIENKIKISDLLAMPFYHPVLEEGIRTALKDALKKIKKLYVR